MFPPRLLPRTPLAREAHATAAEWGPRSRREACVARVEKHTGRSRAVDGPRRGGYQGRELPWESANLRKLEPASGRAATKHKRERAVAACKICACRDHRAFVINDTSIAKSPCVKRDDCICCVPTTATGSASFADLVSRT